MSETETTNFFAKIWQRIKDKWNWWSLRDSYKEQLIREIKGIYSCQDCIFRWWVGQDCCLDCDGTPRDWGYSSNKEDLALAGRMSK